jgi:hypothetical protein
LKINAFNMVTVDILRIYSVDNIILNYSLIYCKNLYIDNIECTILNFDSFTKLENVYLPEGYYKIVNVYDKNVKFWLGTHSYDAEHFKYFKYHIDHIDPVLE